MLEVAIVLAHLLVHAHLFQLHVQLEDLFQQIGRNHLLLRFAGAPRLFGGRLRLLFQLHALQAQQVFGARDRIFQRAIGVVELRTLFQAPCLFVVAAAPR